MSRSAFALALCLASTPAVAFERLGVVSVADPPRGPDADLAELAHQLRAACRDRIGGVEDVPTMRARLLGQTSNATLSELDRAYGGALAVYQNGEFESALRTLHAIVEDLESLPESEDSYSQWVRAQLRLAHAALTLSREAEAEAALYALARTDPSIVAEPDQYSPSYRRRFEGVKARVRALPVRRLTVTSEGRPGTVFVNGRAMGTTPLTLPLPAGSYRVGGAADELRVPSFRVDLRAEDRGVVLDFALAEALRVNAGPGLALGVARRGDGIVRAGAWLGVDRVIAVSRVFEGQAAFLLGSIYDVRRGALQREGAVRMVAGGVPAANLGALAAFLLTGQSSRDVRDRTEEARDRDLPVAAAPTPFQAPAAAAPLAAAPAAAPPSPAAAVPSPAPAPPAPAVAPSSAGAPPPPAAPSDPASVATPSLAPSEPSSNLTARAALAPAKPAVAAPPSPEAARAAAREPGPAPALASASAQPGPLTSPAQAPPSLSAIPPPTAEDRGAVASLVVPRTSRGWTRPAAIGAGALAGVFTAVAVHQGLSARGAYADADAMLEDGVFVPGSDPARYDQLLADGDAARRNAYVSAGVAVAFAAAAGYLGWRSVEPAPPGAIALRF